MMTNGGARKPDYWRSLAETAGDKMHVVFGIDGLADTNHLYRRHVQWDKLIENAQAFIGAGGKAKWQFIKFPWNKHQVEQAKELSKQIQDTLQENKHVNLVYEMPWFWKIYANKHKRN